MKEKEKSEIIVYNTLLDVYENFQMARYSEKEVGHKIIEIFHPYVEDYIGNKELKCTICGIELVKHDEYELDVCYHKQQKEENLEFMRKQLVNVN